MIGIPAFGLLAGVGGVALALAAQPTVENLFGGVSIFTDTPFRVGNVIRYGGEARKVERIGPRPSRIRGLDGTLTTVPNNDLAKRHIVNVSDVTLATLALVGCDRSSSWWPRLVKCPLIQNFITKWQRKRGFS
ncbi:MAG: mechanosensitive ion channel [Alphaproteobacteria bacterium]|jgi:hypothetical protein|nr:mechanosensitive ion channel [Alphaproteobacteria bacterium]